MLRLVLAAILIVVFSYLYWKFRRAPQAKKKQWLMYLAIYGAIALAVILVATGRAHWLTAVVAAVAGLLYRSAPLLMRFWPLLSKSILSRRGASQTNSPNSSSVETEYLVVELNHDSGDIQGHVKSGTYAGQALGDLSLEQLQKLLEEYARSDSDSYQLLQAYAQRQYQGQFEDDSHSQQQSQSSNTGNMTSAEALAILGLEGEPTPEQINRAYKKLMSKLHPDHGGSNYLAAKVNKAKETLLEKIHE